jgi:hypothetical protein
MTGIYEDSFVDLLKQYLGEIKISRKNIICRCPYCEIGSDKKHFHLYVSLETPIFHCFKSECNQKGTVEKLIYKLSGKKDDTFYDKSLQKSKVETIKIDNKSLKIPELNLESFNDKLQYINKRSFDTDICKLQGLIFDINLFLLENNLMTDDIKKYKDFLQENFIGFLTRNQSTLILRNIDEKSKLRYHKIEIKQIPFADYYAIYEDQFKSDIILAEGIFDILVEKKIDSINKKESSKLYAACLSSNYESLIKSLAYNDLQFRQHIHILSDRGISIEYYKKVKNNLKHLIDSLVVYYNNDGKDFGDGAKNIEKFIL